MVDSAVLDGAVNRTGSMFFIGTSGSVIVSESSVYATGTTGSDIRVGSTLLICLLPSGTNVSERTYLSDQ